MIYQLDSKIENSLQTLLNQIGTTKNATIDLQHNTTNTITEYKCTKTIVIPKNINLRFEQGAVLKIVSPNSLFIQGNIQAGLYMIFDGKVTLTEYPFEGYVDWFKNIQDSIDSGCGNLVFGSSDETKSIIKFNGTNSLTLGSSIK